MKSPLIVTAGFLLAAVLAATGQSPAVPSTDSTAPQSTIQLQQRNPRYQIKKSDNFEVSFSFTPEFNQTVTVEPDGYISLRDVGSIHVEGKTIPELTEEIRAAYSGILHDPVIAIALKDFDKAYFIASGQVARPGKYDLRGPLTITEGVAIAGGFNDQAKHSQVVLFHPNGNGLFETKLIDVKKLLAKRNLNEDIYLQPGDLLYVPQNALSKIRKFLPQSAVGAYYNTPVNR